MTNIEPPATKQPAPQADANPPSSFSPSFAAPIGASRPRIRYGYWAAAILAGCLIWYGVISLLV